ncbi:MAG: glycosyltransferase family 4 protein [Actinomycetota bacterium]|nr:glycosyltransferase family 4 protein [Actinomycetota bacterium]
MTVIVSVPSDGPLVSMLQERGALMRFDPVPVVRRSALSARGIARLGSQNVVGAVRLARQLRRARPDVLYVNTMTIPVWIAAARLTRVPVVCHIHEAEDSDSKLILKTLLAPLRFTTGLIANSKAAIDAMTAVYPSLERRARLIYNGIPNPPNVPVYPSPSKTFRVAAVCRLSPRKAPDVAIDAIARLRAEGRNVSLVIYGTAFTGYEWFEQQLRERAGQPDLDGAVTFGGYVSPVWDALAAADAVVAPSLREPFGNAVVEAQLARRPVVASATMGHLETVQDGETGLLVPPNDPQRIADAIATLMDHPELAKHLGDTGRASAIERFSVQRYRTEIADAVAALHR